MLHLLETSKFTPVIGAAQRLLDMIENGKLFSEDPADKAEAVIVADTLQTNVSAAGLALEDSVLEDSPFLRHRETILGGYSTAQRLAELTLHLWNPHNPVQLGRLLRNADQRHKAIAFELIASYAEHGENDPHFMNLADEIRDLKSVAALAA